MRVNQDMLIKFAQDVVQKRFLPQKDVCAIYLVGSVLQAEPLLGGSTDIDLVVVHDEDPPARREILRVTREISVDIQHHGKSLYAQQRQLRLDPWMGSALKNKHHHLLFDREHWFDFVQASAASQFDREDYTLQRARNLLENARATWMTLESPFDPLPPLTWLHGYLNSIAEAANAVVVLHGAPLPLRRLLLAFPAYAEAAGQAGLSAALQGLIGANLVSIAQLQHWRADWETSLQKQGRDLQNAPAELHPYRLAYYTDAFDALVESGNPSAGLWVMLNTWKEALRLEADTLTGSVWQEVLDSLNLQTAKNADRVEALDALLDHIDIILSRWGNAH